MFAQKHQQWLLVKIALFMFIEAVQSYSPHFIGIFTRKIFSCLIFSCLPATQPEYTSAPKWDTQYGVESKKGKIVLQVRGYPLPTIHWYLNDEKLDYGDNYTASLSANGTVTLEIKQVRQDSYGTYKCYAENEHGAAVKFVKYEYAGKTLSVFYVFTVNIQFYPV